MSKKWIFALLAGLAVTATIVVLAVSNFTSAPAPAPTPQVSDVASRAVPGGAGGASASIGSDPFRVKINTTGAVPEEQVSYTLTLTGEKDTTPMPEGSTGNVCTLIVKLPAEEGKEEKFPPITYNTLGTYKYVLALTAVSHEDAVWDKSVKYTLTMTVIHNEKTGKMEIVPSIRNKDGEKIPGPMEFDVEYPKMKLTVTKVWDDGDNRLGIRPENLKVSLADSAGEFSETVTLNEANQWTAMVEVPVKEGIVYTWTEEGIDGYRPAEGSPAYDEETRTTTFTNILDAETVRAAVKKVWADGNNKDGKRPASITMNLMRRPSGSEGVYTTIDYITLNEDNSWAAAVELPAFVGGKRMEYAWTEEIDSRNRYQEVHVTEGDASDFTVTFTNTLADEFTVIKEWVDEQDPDARPAVITVYVTDGEKTYSQELNVENDWTATFELPLYNGDGELIDYVWTEEYVPGYTMTMEKNGNTIIITNTRLTEVTVDPTSIETTFATKIVEGSGFAEKEFSFTLREVDAEGKEIVDGEKQSKTLKFNLAAEKPVGFDEIKYTEAGTYYYKVQETTEAKAGDGWTLDTAEKTVTVVIEDNGEGALEVKSVTGVEIKNSYEAGSVTVDPTDEKAKTVFGTKVVEGEGFAEKEFSFTLREVDAEGKEIAGGENQSKTLKFSEAGSKIIGFEAIRYTKAGTYYYQVQETTTDTESGNWTLDTKAKTVTVVIKDNGEGALEVERVTGVEITNTYRQAMTTLTVYKEWRDANDPNARPLSITVYLTGSDGSSYSQVLSANDNWQWTVSVPMYHNGKLITYTWAESTVRGYRGTQTTTGNVTVFVNTRTGGGVVPPTPPTPETIDEPGTPLGLGQVYINVGDCLE